MTATQTDRYPQPYEPVAPHSSRLVKWGLAFTSRARALRALSGCYRRNHDSDSARSLVVALEQLQNSKKKKASNEKIVLEIVAYLAWRAVRDVEPDSASEWLRQLPVSDERHLPLRWSLVEKLPTPQHDKAHLEHAKLLLSDSRMTSGGFDGAVFRTVSVVYERHGPQACSELLRSAKLTRSWREKLNAAYALCQAPPRFGDAATAKRFAKAADPDRLVFSTRMRADSLVLATRAAEWELAADRMQELAFAALKLVPNHEEGRYWLIRSRLQKPTPPAVTDGELMGLPESAPLKRLRLMAALHDQPTLDNADRALSVVDGSLGAPDTMERTIALYLFRRALRCDADCPDTQIERSARICRNIETFVGRQLQFQPIIALSEIRVGRKFVDAVGRLERSDVIGRSGAATLARIARLLGGMPSVQSEKATNDVVSTARAALEVLVVAGKLKDVQGLAAGLDGARKHPWCSAFPDLGVVVSVLQYAVSKVIQRTGGAAVDVHLPNLELDSPPIARWLVTRANEQPALPFSSPIHSPVEIGELVLSMLKRESQLASRLATARGLLSAGDAQLAFDLLRELDVEVQGLGLLSQIIWRAPLTYWQAMAAARGGRYEEAEGMLKRLLSGRLGHSARAQLAMLAVARGDLSMAENHLASSPGAANSPAGFYTRGLMLERSGRTEEAQEQLRSCANLAAENGSPYGHAARRLLAAMAERAGDSQKSESLHSALLEEYPNDEVAIIRLGRSMLHDRYVSFRTDGASENWTVKSPKWGLFPQIETRISWWPPYALLYDLISAPDDSLPALNKTVNSLFGDTDRSFAWQQTLASRFIRARRPNDALRVLTHSRQQDVPPWLQRLRLLLQTWRGLTRLADETSRDEASKELAHCLQDFEELGAADATTIWWRTMCELGTKLGDGAPSIPIERWSALAPHPMAHIPFLFDADSQLRQTAAETLVPLLDSDGAGWSEEQRRMLQILAAWACEKDDAFLEQYACLKPELKRLPVHERDLWAPAALIRYSRADWKSLTGECLPDSLADMSDPLVCLILELADARATVGSLKNLDQRVAQKIKGIQSNLAALVEKLDAAKAEAGAS